MSRFDDLKKHLQDQAAAQENAEQDFQRKLINARERHKPQLRQAYDVLEDYYKSILLEKDSYYGLRPRYKDGPTPNELRNLNELSILYAYVANIISPPSQAPYRDDWERLFQATAPKIGEMNHHIWHPNIALHFSALISPQRGDSALNNTELTLHLRAWGIIHANKDQKEELITQGISLNQHDGGWDHPATYISIYPHVDKIENQVTSALMILNENIVNHKRAFEDPYNTHR